MLVSEGEGHAAWGGGSEGVTMYGSELTTLVASSGGVGGVTEYGSVCNMWGGETGVIDEMNGLTAFIGDNAPEVSEAACGVGVAATLGVADPGCGGMSSAATTRGLMTQQYTYHNPSSSTNCHDIGSALYSQ